MEIVCKAFFIGVVGVILFGLGIFLRHCSRFSGKDVKWYYEVLPFVFSSIGFLGLLNSAFFVINYCMEKNSFFIPSVLTPGETLAMVTSFFGAVGIAFFQFRIQKLLKRNSENHEKDIEEEHDNEVKAKRIQNLRALESCIGRAYNYNLPEANVFSMDNHGAETYRIVVENEAGNSCFFQPDLSVTPCVSVILKEEIHGNLQGYGVILSDSKFVLKHNKLELMLDKQALGNHLDIIHQFFLDAASMNFPFEKKCGLRIKVYIGAKDAFMETKDKKGKDCFSLKYLWKFDIVPTGGYDYQGGFSLKIRDATFLPEI